MRSGDDMEEIDDDDPDAEGAGRAVTEGSPVDTDALEVEPGRLAAATKVRSFPTTPGVYLMKDGAGRVIYVGKAKNLRARAGSGERLVQPFSAAVRFQRQAGFRLSGLDKRVHTVDLIEIE